MLQSNTKVAVIILTLIVSALGVGIYPYFSSPVTTAFNAVADARTCSLYPTLNFGGGKTQQAGRDPAENLYNYIWMKFDLSSVPAYANVTQVALATYCERVGDAGSYEVTYGSNDWTESAITWNNQPSIDAAAGASDWIDTTMTGWHTWKPHYMNKYCNYVMTHLKSDKKFTLVMLPNRGAAEEFMYSDWRMREYGGGFNPQLVLEYEIPTYTLSVHTENTEGTAVDATVEVLKDSTVMQSGTAYAGDWSTTIEAGGYTVKATYKGETKTKTKTVTSDTSVSFTTFSPPVPPAKTYTLSLTVKDQLAHPLPATVKVDEKTRTCDSAGKTSVDVTTAKGETSVTTTVTATVTVGEKTFKETLTETISKDTSKPITITRRFLWKFYINYTDGALAEGTLKAVNHAETLTTSITNGRGSMYPLDGDYTFTFEASPAVAIGTHTVDGDKKVYVTLSPPTLEEKSEVVTSSETATDEAKPAEYPMLLLPTMYMYIFTALIAIAIVIFAVVMYVRRKKT